ncbi:plasmid mobilization relaxosome protein MobC [Marinomonas mediterranea]|uniref:plasmid mobilization relaxosome protein MobC n=1 Tax=Marinomonas mediterranea TaxID=119864 RepID=UPI00234B49E9|nr:plasmid mobilization relaxosome protein MobC [Marinomonas mediterranea]
MPILVPYSIRLSNNLRRAIREQAQKADQTESLWIREALIAACDLPAPQQAKLHPEQRSKELSQILYLLGKSRYANNLNQIAKAANTGTLIISPDVYAQIDESHHAILWMRSTLITALGLKA